MMCWLLCIDPPQEADNGGAQKPSIEILEENYKELNSRKIKDSLSSFLPDIPGIVVWMAAASLSVCN